MRKLLPGSIILVFFLLAMSGDVAQTPNTNQDVARRPRSPTPTSELAMAMPGREPVLPRQALACSGSVARFVSLLVPQIGATSGNQPFTPKEPDRTDRRSQQSAMLSETGSEVVRRSVWTVPVRDKVELKRDDQRPMTPGKVT